LPDAGQNPAHVRTANRANRASGSKLTI